MESAIKYTESGKEINYRMLLKKYMEFIKNAEASKGRPNCLDPNEWAELVKIAREK